MGQVIPLRTMLTHEFQDSVYYRVSCGCGNPDCDMILVVEYDDQDGRIILHMRKSLTWRDNDRPGGRFKRFMYRFKMAWQLIKTGKVRGTGTMVIDSIDHIESFQSALKDGLKKIRGFTNG